MQHKSFLGLLLIATISLTGCHSTTGNVIPQRGPAMEAVYDSMGEQPPKTSIAASNLSADNNTQAEADLNDIHRAQAIVPEPKSASLNIQASQTSVFRALPNPELKLYVYPHFAGEDEVPIPGYYTAFNAYEKTYYALPTDTR